MFLHSLEACGFAVLIFFMQQRGTSSQLLEFSTSVKVLNGGAPTVWVCPGVLPIKIQLCPNLPRCLNSFK